MIRTRMSQIAENVIEPGDELYITPTRYLDWRVLAELHGCLMWGREGLVRRVDTDVLVNALSIYADYKAMVDAGRLVAIPNRAVSIRWEQARAVEH